jgi:hypothetical protein
MQFFFFFFPCYIMPPKIFIMLVFQKMVNIFNRNEPNIESTVPAFVNGLFFTVSTERCMLSSIRRIAELLYLIGPFAFSMATKVLFVGVLRYTCSKLDRTLYETGTTSQSDELRCISQNFLVTFALIQR